MKKLIIVTLVVLSVAAVAFGQQVLSRNAVGYQQVTLPKGQLSLVRHDFEELDTPLTVSNVFASLPQNSKVYLWKADQSGYQTYTKAFGVGWTGATNELERGRAFWVQIPATAASNNYQAFLMGEVPDRFTATNTTIPVAAGFTLSGYSYPVDQYWTNMSIAKMAPNNSKIHVWNGSGYVTYTKAFGVGWSAATNLVITPGMGFWLQWAAATNWNEVKPYTWP
ncbi:MAG TPA: hypothetical protein P5567_13515 [Kiritimatiellia bacterium]|nr:hypothetical protein [Kiritimatiellia bacterium]HSA19661.1 hypothetical protein [Kiritimatiellia bacterium]